MSVEKDVGSVDEKVTKAGDNRNVPAGTYAAELTAEARGGLNRAESLSSYFTILAAGFGLISDGCRFWL
jgi:hypothetical protein